MKSKSFIVTCACVIAAIFVTVIAAFFAFGVSACNPTSQKQIEDIGGFVYTFDDLKVSYSEDFDGEKLTERQLELNKQVSSNYFYSFKTDGRADMSAEILSIKGTVHGTYAQDGDKVTFTSFIGGVKYSEELTVDGDRIYSVEDDESGMEIQSFYKRSGAVEEALKEPESITERDIAGTYKFQSLVISTSYLTVEYAAGQVAEGVPLNEDTVELQVRRDNFWFMNDGTSGLNETVWGKWEIGKKSLGLREAQSGELQSATLCGNVLTLSEIQDGFKISVNLKKTGGSADGMPFEYIDDVSDLTFVFGDIEVVDGELSAAELKALKAYHTSEKLQFDSGNVKAWLHDSGEYGYDRLNLSYEQDGKTIELINNRDESISCTLDGFTLEYLTQKNGVTLKYTYTVVPMGVTLAGHTYAFIDVLLYSGHKEWADVRELNRIRNYYKDVTVAFYDNETFEIIKGGEALSKGKYKYSSDGSVSLEYSGGGNNWVSVWGANIAFGNEIDPFADVMFAMVS